MFYLAGINITDTILFLEVSLYSIRFYLKMFPKAFKGSLHRCYPDILFTVAFTAHVCFMHSVVVTIL